MEDAGGRVSLSIENPSSRLVAVNIHLELLDTLGKIRAAAEVGEKLKTGTNAVNIPLKISSRSGAGEDDLLWYRLAYRVTPVENENARLSQTEGIVSLSEIAPEMFELRVVAPGYAREGSRFSARVRAVHPVTLKPVRNVALEGEISFGDNHSVPKAKSLTDADGYATLDFNLPRSLGDTSGGLKIRGRRGLFTREAESSVYLSNQARILVSTDKPIYQPGQTLHVRALVFDPSQRALADATATLKISDPERTVLFRAPLKTSRFGVAYADWPIPENTRLGDYNIEIEADGARFAGSRGYAEVKISRYELPNFTVSVKPDRAYYLPGQNAKVEVRADYLFGQPVKRGRVRVVRESQRHWNFREQKWETEEGARTEGETDASGHFIAHINLRGEHERLADEDSARYNDISYAAYFTDPTTNRTEQRRFELRVTKSALHVYVERGNEDFREDFPLKFFVTTFYADGTPAQSEVAISEVASQDSQSDSQHQMSEARTLSTVKTNSFGVAKVAGLTLPKRDGRDSRVWIKLVARDSNGAQGEHTETFWLTSSPVLRVETDRSLYRAGEPLKVSITGSEPELKLSVDVAREGSVISSQIVEMHDGRAQLLIPYNEEMRDEVTVLAYSFSGRDPDNMAYGARTVLFPRDRDLRLDVRMGQESYRPGEEAHASFSVRTPEGHAAESALGVIVFDRAVEERARTDEEFGGQFGFYQFFRRLRGEAFQVAGITLYDLERVDLSKPQPEGLDVVAETLLSRGYEQGPEFFESETDLNQAQVFAKLIAPQMKPVDDALRAYYRATGDYPMDEAKMKKILLSKGIDFDHLLDPWGVPYRTVWSIERDTDALNIYSSGADKKFGTEDDFTVAQLRWPYFVRTGEAINAAAAEYHKRTGSFIRDEAVLASEMLKKGVELKSLRDRWGKPYRFEFKV